MARPGILLDRDGVINQNRDDHVKRWSEFQFIPGTLAALRRLTALDLPIVVVTNQGIINRSIISDAELGDIHVAMTERIHAAGGRLDGIFYCPHHAAEGCGCRKPEPGLLFQAARAFDLDLTRSVFVGDATTDLIAGQRSACPTILVRTGRGRAAERELRARSVTPLYTARDLLASVPMIERHVAGQVEVPRRAAISTNSEPALQPAAALLAGSSD